jgi:LysM repeat protein
MRARKTGRFLAPLAIVAVVVATALVVKAGLGTTHHAAAKAPAVFATRHRVSKKRTYVIRSGDTLSTISVKTGVPVAQLQALNPGLAANPNALQTGQSLRLR